MSSIKKTLLILSLILAGMPRCHTNQYTPPNIIYILADDLGYGELGCYGQQLIETPKIDQLASTGMRFTQHYAGSPVCAPSRCVLLTGRHTGHAFIRGNDEWAERGEVWNYSKAVENPILEGQRPIPDSIPTLGEVLQDAGYKTAIVGKWGLGGPTTDGVPNNRGFDFFFGYNCQRQAHNLYPAHLWKNREKVWLDNDLIVPGTKLDSAANPLQEGSYAKYTQKEYAPSLMQKEALDFIELNAEQPFFLYYASPLPHVPLQVPDEYVQHYVEKFGSESPYLGDKGYFPNRYPRAAYAGMIGYLDHQVGEIVEKLKILGIYENTIIMFSSDNGPSYAGGADPQYFDSAKPFQAQYGRAKGFTYEGGIRVPFIVSWPGKVAAGSSSSHISAFWDILPTISELTGAELPIGMDGISMVPVLLGEDNQKEHEFLYWEFPAYGGQQAVRMGDWKAIRRNLLNGDIEVELYNLADDHTEQQDISGEYQDVLGRIEDIMLQEHVESQIERFKIEALGDIKSP
jgi:arylsulfatase A-like enzyme